MSLGDIKGAFLAAGDLPKRYRPLYASLPKGGIPGVPENALIEVVGHVYGLNDSPSAWYRKLHQELVRVGFERSRFDACLFYFREHGQLKGVYGVHVDDCVTGGCGTAEQPTPTPFPICRRFSNSASGGKDRGIFAVPSMSKTWKPSRSL